MSTIQEATYRCKYEYRRRWGQPLHVWSLIGERGGIHLHISDRRADDTDIDYSGGIEIHYRTPPDYVKHQPPSDGYCWLLKAPCWHDGSSPQAQETWIPLWQSLDGDHDAMFKALQDEANSRFQ